MATISKAPIIIDRLKRHYDADNDLIPGAPRVTWADNELIELIEILTNEVMDLRQRLKELDQKS